jgi:ribose transport system ATP-binding protein
MTEIVLQMENVSKSYVGVRALDNVSLDCRAGEVHAILGENGSGKSTLMKIASGAVNPNSGPFIRTTVWCANSPSRRTSFSAPPTA